MPQEKHGLNYSSDTSPCKNHERLVSEQRAGGVGLSCPGIPLASHVWAWPWGSVQPSWSKLRGSRVQLMELGAAGACEGHAARRHGLLPRAGLALSLLQTRLLLGGGSGAALLSYFRPLEGSQKYPSAGDVSAEVGHAASLSVGLGAGWGRRGSLILPCTPHAVTLPAGSRNQRDSHRVQLLTADSREVCSQPDMKPLARAHACAAS